MCHTDSNILLMTDVEAQAPCRDSFSMVFYTEHSHLLWQAAQKSFFIVEVLKDKLLA